MQYLLPLATLTGLVLIMTGLLAVEARRHRRALDAVPIRVHVNGTRGKTAVADLVGAALRDAGLRAWTKTTGKGARTVDGSGVARPIEGRTPPSVREQMSFMALVAGRGGGAAVVECMALSPDLQEASARMVDPTVAVITNVRTDHTDVMGPTTRDIARSLARSIPEGGVLVTAERRHLGVIRRAARERGTRVVVAPRDLPPGFSPRGERPENVSVTLAVLDEIGIAREHLANVLRDRSEIPPPWRDLDVEGRRVVLFDALGANDVESTSMALTEARRGFPGMPVVGVFCGRGDRPARAVEMAEGFVARAGLTGLVAAGPTGAIREGRLRGITGAPGIDLVDDGARALDAAIRMMDGDVVVFAFGNRECEAAKGVIAAAGRPFHGA